MLAEAFSDDKYNIEALVMATVDLYTFHGFFQIIKVLVCDMKHTQRIDNAVNW